MITIKCTSVEKERILEAFMETGACPFSKGCYELPNNNEEVQANCSECVSANIKWDIVEDHYENDNAADTTKKVKKAIENFDSEKITISRSDLSHAMAKTMAKMMTTNPSILLLANELSSVGAGVLYLLFDANKEEK